MPYTFEDKTPKILAKNYFIAGSTDVIGSVIIRHNITILSNTVVRADNEIIDIGENTNIQDGAVWFICCGLASNNKSPII